MILVSASVGLAELPSPVHLSQGARGTRCECVNVQKWVVHVRCQLQIRGHLPNLPGTGVAWLWRGNALDPPILNTWETPIREQSWWQEPPPPRPTGREPGTFCMLFMCPTLQGIVVSPTLRMRQQMPRDVK